MFPSNSLQINPQIAQFTTEFPLAGVAPEISDRGAGASDSGAKMTEKLCFRVRYFSPPARTQFSSDGRGLDASEGAVVPLALPWRHH